MHNKKYIAVFCSAAELPEKYVTPAKEFARLLGERGYHLVWGGSDRGLMKVIADEIEKAGGDLIGVSIELFKNVLRKGITETIISPTLAERKATMLDRCDAIVILVGGSGTLDEATEVIELRKQGKHDKPILLLNTQHFYDGLQLQLETMEKEGFMPRPLPQLITFVKTPKEAVTSLDTYFTS